ncbi:non-ribosomal peptide synthetase [Rhodobacter sp. CZR27]|uniref:non-ribosomal peptide synthetase n=1 Tax=Rhodobacter sp. CZR27 TaxID=2033869 RepID=UPI000BBE7F71|nr:non-ribosomal peptide synthetase [Rhodobacter sp. CZR27]
MTRPAPVSHAQTALWFGAGDAAGSSEHNLLWLLAFRGPLDVGRLAAALAAVVARHETLRSVFLRRGERIERQVRPAPPAIRPERLALAPGETARSLATAFGLRPYDLAGEPPVRFGLLERAPDDHVLFCGFHHLVTDGTSWPVFVADLLAALEGRPLPPLPARYSDHCRWQQATEASGAWEEARRHWRGLLAGLPEPWQLQLAGEPAPGLVPDHEGAHRVIPLSPGLSARLRERAAAWRTSPFRIAFAAWIALLHLETRREVLPVATTWVGRSRHWAGVVGFFVNTGIVTARLDPGTPFRALMDQTAALIDAGVAHEEFPYRLALREAPPGPHRHGVTPLSFTRMPTSRPWRCNGMEVTEERLFLPRADRDLAAYFQDERGTFRLHLVHRTAALGAEAVARLAERFPILLADALERPDCPVDALEILPPADRRRILGDWNATDCAFPAKPLHRLVEAQAARTPGRIALVSPEGALTYRDLDGRANALARLLQARGAGRGSIVPLLMTSSAAMVIAELAVLKTGAAFAPLDPQWPANRLARLLDRLGSGLVLVAQEGDRDLALAGAGGARPGTAREVLALDGLALDPEAGPLDVPVSLGDPIYCIFTSGSTGEPKGAINAHAGVVNRLFSMTRVFGSPEADRVLATAPATADTHVWQYFWPLAFGGRTVVMPRDRLVLPERIVGTIGTHGITFADFIPSIFRTLVAHLKAHEAARPALAGLGRIILGGEAMETRSVREFRALFPGIAICNTYGPTEASIAALHHQLGETIADPVPIGRPFPNIRAVILDRHGRPVPVGMVGELCLGGVCVGLGYLGDPETTARKFIPNPFPELGCDRLYRTGDLARFRADGVIDFLGRADDQIKLRGARIEPGEVEAALLRHPAVAEAAVGLSAERDRLVAWLVADPAAPPPEAAELADALRAELPPHMVPSGFTLLPALPLAPSGKLDRRALAGAAGVPLPVLRRSEAPRDETERRIERVWRKVLGQERIGIHDNFFSDLGGDSLKALTCLLELEAAGVPAGIRDLYMAQDIASLARRLGSRPAGRAADGPAGAAAGPAPDAARLEAALLERQRPYLSSWSGERVSPAGLLFMRNAGGGQPPLFWCFQGFQEFRQLAERFATRFAPDRPLVGMRSGHLIMDYDDPSLDALTSAYAREVQALWPEGPVYLGGNCQGGRVAHRLARQLRRQGRETALLILMEESLFEPHAGRLALVFGRDSKLNPWRDGGDPGPLLAERYPGLASVDIVPGAHGQFFEDRHVDDLARALATRLDEACAAGRDPRASPADRREADLPA